MVLHIDGLGDTSQRNLCEEALLKIRVFLALLFKWLFKDANPLGFEIRGSGVNDSINRGYKGSASGEKWEWRRDAGPIPGYSCGSRTEWPDYLPEDENPTKEQQRAVYWVGSHPEGGASWLSTAENFLSRWF